jgi:hypothetical protein
MKRTTMLFATIVLAVSACNNAPETAEAPKAAEELTAAPAPEPVPDSATQANNWMESMTPGEIHKSMAAMDGTWNTETTFWMAEGAPPQTSKGTCENKMILGGRYQHSEFKGDMMGMPFEGIGCTGYDNSKKLYSSTWIDNMGTGIMYMEGQYDDASKSLEMKGNFIDAGTRRGMAVRQVMKTIDDKNIVMEMYNTPEGGKEFKSMEMKMTRK